MPWQVPPKLTEVEYAREVGGADTKYAIPDANNMIMRTLAILPSANYFVKISLDGNAEFDNEVVGGDLPATGRPDAICRR